MTDDASDWRTIAAGCAEAGAPIPLEVFLASQGVSPTAAKCAAPPPDNPLTRAKGPQDEAELYASDEYRAIEAGLAAWRDTVDRTARSDLVGKPIKTVATILEKEIKQAVAGAFGDDIGGSAAEGVDIPDWLVDIKTSISGQSRLRFGCDCEKALGVGEHLVVVTYELEGNLFKMEQAKFVPAWRTADLSASLRAEELRRAVNAGEMTNDLAAACLVAEDYLRSVCSHIGEALAADAPIHTGVLGLTKVAPVWQANHRGLDALAFERGVGRVGKPTKEKVAKATKRQERVRHCDPAC